MKSGVRKSGWPIPRLMMSRPWAASTLARASTAKAFSSPIRSKAAAVFSIGHSRRQWPGSSPDQSAKIKCEARALFVAAEARPEIAPELKTDIGVRVVAQINAAIVIKRPGREFVCAAVFGRSGRSGHFGAMNVLVPVRLLYRFGRRRRCHSNGNESGCGEEQCAAGKL